MTTEEILEFCKKHGVEIYFRFDEITDALVLKMRKGNMQTVKAISAESIMHVAFDLSGRVLLREMAKELEEAEKNGRQNG